MDLGKIIVEGNPQDLVQKHIGSEVIETDNTSEVLSCIKENGGRYNEFGDKIHVFTDEPERLMSKLIPRCKMGKVTVRHATLEDVFLKLTGRYLRE